VAKIDGIHFRVVDHLTARKSQPGDTNYLGEPIDEGKTVFVRKKDCEENADGTLDPYTADPIPMLASERSDRRAYGEWKKQKNRKGQWVEGEYLKEYYTCSVYILDEESNVRLGTIYSKNDPRVRDIKQVTEEKREDQNEKQPA